MDIQKYWMAVIEQQADAMRSFFHPNAVVNWHNTNERFTAEEFIRVNCEYPGQWAGELQRVAEAEGLLITAVHVYSRQPELSFHVSSFMKLKEDKIISPDEYWGDDGPPPKWRQDKQIGWPIC